MLSRTLSSLSLLFFALLIPAAASSAATNPVFLSSGVSPSVGVQNSTVFRWTSSARNADGLPITMILHIVNPSGADVVFYMAYNSGTTTGGANFSYDKTLTGTGMYQYYFVAQTAAGGSTRYPSSGNFSGPRSDPAAAADFIGSWINVPQIAVAGRAVTLEGQVMNVGGATAGASYAQFVVSSMNTTGAHTDQRAVGSAMYVSALAPNASSPKLTATWVPDQTGVFYVSLAGDWYNGVAESNEANNAYAPWPKITTAQPLQAAGDHKVGLVLISAPSLDADPLNGTYMTTYRRYLDEILQQVAAGRPSRINGAQSVRLAVQLEVRWVHTETCEGCYNFAWYDQFAAECRARGIRWTPLLSTHYMPSFYRTRYAADALTAVSGAAYDPFASDRQYLKHSPSSAIWSTEAARWAIEFVRYMSARGHLGPNGVIDEILVGNELAFPTGPTLTSGDNASRVRWSQLWPGTPYPTSWNSTFMNFRGDALGSMLGGLVGTVKNELAQQGYSSLPVSTKVVSYLLYRDSAAFPQSDADRYSGYTPGGMAALAQTADFAAIDSYPKLAGRCSGMQWTFAEDLSNTRLQLNRGGMPLPIYATEFNLNAVDCASSKLQELDVYRSYESLAGAGGRYLTLFAYNVQPSTDYYHTTPEQMRGLKLVFDALAP